MNGFAIAWQAVKEIAAVVGSGSNSPIICGLARALTKDIDVRALVTVLIYLLARLQLYASRS